MGEVAMIDVTKIPHDRVGLGSRVVILDTSKEEEIAYLHLVTSEDADVTQGRVSTSLAHQENRCLVRKSVLLLVKLVTHSGGTRELEILSLQTIHDFIVPDDKQPEGKPGEQQGS